VPQIQWTIEQGWNDITDRCSTNVLSFPKLEVDLTMSRILENPTSLTPPLEIQTMIDQAMRATQPQAPPLPPPPGYVPAPPQQHNPYQPQGGGQPAGRQVVHQNQPASIRCTREHFRDVIHPFGIGLVRTNHSVVYPRLSDGKVDCLKFGLLGYCDDTCARADPSRGGSVLAHQPVIAGTPRLNNLEAFKNGCESRAQAARGAPPAEPDF